MVLWCFFPPLFCPLKPQLVEADGHPGSARGFFLLKGSRFSPQSPGTLRTGDWTEKKFRCNLLVSLARKLFLNWLCMNELDLIGL